MRSEGMATPPSKLFTWGILTWVRMGSSRTWIVWLARHFSLVGGAWKRSLPGSHSGFLISSALHNAAAVAIVLTVKPWDNMGTSTFWQRFLSRMQISLAGDLLVYGGIVGVCYAIDYYRKYREREFVATQLENQLAQAQLESLRMQLHPHFLFNTLNGIVAWCVITRTMPRSVCLLA
jgi:hypothetical protein